MYLFGLIKEKDFKLAWYQIKHSYKCNIWKDAKKKQKKVSYVSASTIRVFVTFSMVNLVFPPFPAILPIALDKWSPFKGFTAHTREEAKCTPIKDCIPSQWWRVQDRLQMFLCRRSISPSVTSKVSRKSSSNLTKARASCKRKVKWSNISVFELYWSMCEFWSLFSFWSATQYCQDFSIRLTSTWNPSMKALTKSAAFVSEPMSRVSLQV